MPHSTPPARDPTPGTSPLPGGEPPILGPLPSARGEPADGDRFRRPERPAPAPGEARVPGSDDPFTASSDVALSAPGMQGARAISEPLAALAAAFQANAEALRKSQEMQAELGRALQRADRSEVLLQSTGALNDTFKGLTTVQRTLVQRLDTQDDAARAGRWFLPLLVLAAVAVVGAGLWLVVKRMEEMEQDVVGNADVATQLEASYERGLDQGRKERGAVADAERQGLADRANRLEQDLASVTAEREAKAAALTQVQDETASLRGEVLTARADALRAKALEEEVGRLRTEAAVRDPEVERLRRELTAEKATAATLRSRLAEMGLASRVPEGGASTPPAPTPSPVAPSDSDAVPVPGSPGPLPAAAPVDGAFDRRGLDRARERMNTILQQTAGSGDYLQLMKVGGVDGSVLTDVVATRYGANGRVVNFVRARTLRITADRLNRRVEFSFADGSLDYGPNSVPFPGGTFATVVASGEEATVAWTGSGLSFVTSK